MRYYRSFLYSEHDDNDLTYSIVFMLDATSRALRALHQYLKEKQSEQAAVAAALRAFPDLNHRQRALIESVLTDPSKAYTFESHRRSHNISLLTSRTDLKGLVERGLLREIKKGR